jgi:hypothetical protein
MMRSKPRQNQTTFTMVLRGCYQLRASRPCDCTPDPDFVARADLHDNVHQVQDAKVVCEHERLLQRVRWQAAKAQPAGQRAHAGFQLAAALLVRVRRDALVNQLVRHRDAVEPGQDAVCDLV